jgi:K+-sensing histidine kinase KdpD
MHRAQTTADPHSTTPQIDANGLMGVLAHELRTPMTTIYAGSAVLAHDQLLPAVRREVAADIYAEAARLFRAVEDLLVLTRIEYDALELTREPVSMPRMINDVVAIEAPRWSKLTVTVDPPGSLPLIEADPAALAHALRNLIADIGWRAQSDTHLRIHATGRDGIRVACWLSDETRTLESADLPTLLDLPSGDGRAEIASPGIGMFVAARLIEEMGGALRVAMRADGLVDIRFDLPAYPGSPTAS